MKKNRFLLCSVIFITIFSSCKKDPPIADFDVTVGNDGKAPAEVVFTNKSEHANSFAWKFVDSTGNIINESKESSPTYTFEEAGVYKVTLYASGKGGSDSKEKPIIINKAPIVISDDPTADFTFSPNGGQAPCEIVFTNKSKNATAYEWDFGNDEKSTEENPIYTYNNSGTYNVVLTAKNGTKEDTKSIEIRIITAESIKADFKISPSSATGQAPFTVNFTNFSSDGVTLLWNFGDGETSTEEHPTHIFQNAGTYAVKLIATKGILKDSITKTITATAPPLPEPPTADFNFSYQTINGLTAGKCKIIFTGNLSTGATSYKWDFNDGNTSNVENPIHEFTSGGNFNVKLTVSNAGGSDSITKIVPIFVPTIANVTKITLISCDNSGFPFYPLTIPIIGTISIPVGWDIDVSQITIGNYQNIVFNDPDIYIKIMDGINVFHKTSSQIDVPDFGGALSQPNPANTNIFWSGLNLNFQINKTYTFEVWDEDTPPDTDDLLSSGNTYSFSGNIDQATQGGNFQKFVDVGNGTVIQLEGKWQ